MHMQEHFGVELMSLIEDPARATIELLAEEVHRDLLKNNPSSLNQRRRQTSTWISPAPTTTRLRLFCLPYAGGVSTNVFARWVLTSSSSKRTNIHFIRAKASTLSSTTSFCRRPIEYINVLVSDMEPTACRWAMMLPASIQVCPVEIPGRGRREGERSINSVAELAEKLALILPFQVRNCQVQIYVSTNIGKPSTSEETMVSCRISLTLYLAHALAQ